MVELDHQFPTGKPIDENWAAILDLERLVPCVEGGSVIERTGPESVKAEIKVKMGAMSMTFKGTVEVVEQDDEPTARVLKVKSARGRRPGLCQRGRRVLARRTAAARSTRGADHRQGGVDGRGRDGHRARRADQGLHREARRRL